jgi:site-specific DNA-adenine methylase
MENATLQASSSSFMGKQTQSLMDNLMEHYVMKLYSKNLNKYHTSSVRKNLHLIQVNADRLLSSAKMAKKLKAG